MTARISFLINPANLLVFVRVDHGSDAVVAEDLGKERFIDIAVEEVGAGYALAAGPRGMLELRGEARVHLVAVCIWLSGS